MLQKSLSDMQGDNTIGQPSLRVTTGGITEKVSFFFKESVPLKDVMNVYQTSVPVSMACKVHTPVFRTLTLT